MSPKLTLNLGLRYELAMPWYETSNHYSDFILQPGPAYGLLVTAAEAGQYGLRNSFATPDTKNFAPRVGLAYQLTPKTVIRSGFGVFYGRTDENLGISSRPTNNPPYFLRSINTGDQIHTLITLSEGIPANILNPNDVINSNVNSWPIHMPLPYTYEWNLNIQRQLGAGFTGKSAMWAPVRTICTSIRTSISRSRGRALSPPRRALPAVQLRSWLTCRWIARTTTR